MIHGELNVPVDEHFSVVDQNNNFIAGLDSTDFTVHVYDPTNNEVSSSVSGFFTELGDGNYKYTFTPNLNGVWYIVVIHPEYFPWGKSDDIKIDEGSQTEIYNAVIKTLGLVHHNIYIDNSDYDEFGNMVSARVRIYSDAASVGTNSNVIETYLITADGTECGKFSYWQQKKI